MKLTRKAAPVALATTLALTLAACAQSDRNTNDNPSSGGGDVKDTITFGAAGAPELFDPFYATDGETFRVTRQMMEGLVGIKPGTADIEPELALSWEASSDGKEWTFKLRDGVKRLTDALDQIKAKVATYREDAREIEVENVAIVN